MKSKPRLAAALITMCYMLAGCIGSFILCCTLCASCVARDVVVSTEGPIIDGSGTQPPVSFGDTTFDAAKEHMLSWQVEAVKNLQLSEAIMYDYLSQKDLLEHEVEQDGSLAALLESAPMYDFNAKLIDAFHKQLNRWFLMRENIAVLFTEKHDGNYYSIILGVGYDGSGGLFLVEYTLSTQNDVLISNIYNGFCPISSGFMPNIAYFEQPILFGFTSLDRYDSQADTKVASDFAFIDVYDNEGNCIREEIASIPSIILIFLDDWNSIAECRLLDKNQIIVEQYFIEAPTPS